MSNNIKGELHFISHANQTVHRRCCFDFEVAAIDRELSTRPQIVSRYGYVRRNRDGPSHAMESEITSDLQFVLIVADRLAGGVRAVEDDVRVRVRLKYDLAQRVVA